MSIYGFEDPAEVRSKLSQSEEVQILFHQVHVDEVERSRVVDDERVVVVSWVDEVLLVESREEKSLSRDLIQFLFLPVFNVL